MGVISSKNAQIEVEGFHQQKWSKSTKFGAYFGHLQAIELQNLNISEYNAPKWIP